jgi:hypothetical protein
MRLRAGALVVAAVLVPSAALADPTPADAAVAREYFRHGIESVDAGRWDDARVAFQRSYEAWPRPYTLLNLAGAESQSGKLVASSEDYRRFLRVVSGPALAQRPAAEAALADVERRMPHLRIVATAPLLPTDTLVVDDKPVAVTMIGVPLPIDPGNHLIVVGRNAAEIARAELGIAASEAKDVTLYLPPAPAPVAVAPSPPSPPPPSPKPEWSRPLPPPPPRVEGVLASPWFWLVTSVALGTTAAVAIAAE